jgi:hypothetical protein
MSDFAALIFAGILATPLEDSVFRLLREEGQERGIDLVGMRPQQAV